MDYKNRLTAQIEQYRDVNIHDLPGIFHYWSNRYVRPRFEALFQSARMADVYARFFKRAIELTGNRHLLSLGSGDSWMEVDVATSLMSSGCDHFLFHCFELSDHLLDRARDRVAASGLSSYFVFHKLDINTDQWPVSECAGVMANQSLHHFVELETIFDRVASAMLVDSVFISNDTIGRNGHQRWPEARLLVDWYWSRVPKDCHFNHQLKRLVSPQFEDWDCSGEGFEGVRAQDIMPLLIRRFGFSHFLAWGGFVDVFVDRGFGHGYRLDDEQHVRVIDEIAQLNEVLLGCGFIKPTQMFAVMTLDKAITPMCYQGLTPEAATRFPD